MSKGSPVSSSRIYPQKVKTRLCLQIFLKQKSGTYIADRGAIQDFLRVGRDHFMTGYIVAMSFIRIYVFTIRRSHDDLSIIFLRDCYNSYPYSWIQNCMLAITTIP